jgi:hypothetical protein
MMESTMLSLRRPAKQTFDAFLDNFNNHGNSKGPYSTLGGRSASLYDEREDLVALRRPAEEDRLTIVLRRYFPFLFMTKRQDRGGRIAYHFRGTNTESCCLHQHGVGSRTAIWCHSELLLCH